MEPDDARNKEIEKIKSEIKCQKDFECCKSGFNKLCRARDLGMRTHLECLEKNPKECIFSTYFADSYFCMCPLRIYIGKNIE